MSDVLMRASLEAVGAFFTRFYHEEPDDIAAATEALQDTGENHQYRADLADAFEQLMSAEFPEGTLNMLVRSKANRFTVDDADAREFLRQTYNLNLLSIRAGS